jgi:hypothetical protein
MGGSSNRKPYFLFSFFFLCKLFSFPDLSYDAPIATSGELSSVNPRVLTEGSVQDATSMHSVLDVDGVGGELKVATDELDGASPERASGGATGDEGGDMLAVQGRVHVICSAR